MAQSILDVARELIERPEAKAAYADDPDGFMTARGLDGLSAADLEDAVGFVAETVPAPVARQMAATPGASADPAPLARLAAASAAEAAVVDVEPGTFDLTALADPSGQLDLPTDSPATGTEDSLPTEEGGEEGVAEAPDEADEPPTDASTHDADGGFGTGAGDTEDGEDDLEEPDEERDGEEPDDGGPAGAESDPVGAKPGAENHSDALETGDEGPLGPVEPPEEPVEDEFEEMI